MQLWEIVKFDDFCLMFRQSISVSLLFHSFIKDLMTFLIAASLMRIALPTNYDFRLAKKQNE